MQQLLIRQPLFAGHKVTMWHYIISPTFDGSRHNFLWSVGEFCCSLASFCSRFTGTTFRSKLNEPKGLKMPGLKPKGKDSKLSMPFHVPLPFGDDKTLPLRTAF